MGTWFTQRPGATYWTQWTGDNLTEIQNDAELAEYLTFTVEQDGRLKVDNGMGTVHWVEEGSWFTEMTKWTDEQLRSGNQELPNGGSYTYDVTEDV